MLAWELFQKLPFTQQKKGPVPAGQNRPKAVSGIPFDSKQSQLVSYALRFDEPPATHTYRHLGDSSDLRPSLIGSPTPQACCVILVNRI
jgi:hypothetical protein